MRSDISALQIKPDGGEIKTGTAVQLNLYATTRRGDADLIPGNAATWASSAASIAEVNRQGRLTPRHAGIVSITATYAGKTARSAFTVTS